MNHKSEWHDEEEGWLILPDQIYDELVEKWLTRILYFSLDIFRYSDVPLTKVILGSTVNNVVWNEKRNWVKLDQIILNKIKLN